MSINENRPCLWCLLVAVMLTMLGAATADIPKMINYQGKVTDSGGVPVADGTYTMRFRVYDAVTGGNLEWDSQDQSVALESGIFNVMLGESPRPSLDLPFDEDYWLLVTFSGEDQSPRKQISSVGYAFVTSRADTAEYAGTAAFAVRSDSASHATNADRVDNLDASVSPQPDQLHPLDSNAKIPNERLYTGSGNGLDADTVDGVHAMEMLSPINQVVRGYVQFANNEYEKTATLSDTINPAKSIVHLSRFLLIDFQPSPNDAACITGLSSTSITIRRSSLEFHGGWVGFQIVEYH